MNEKIHKIALANRKVSKFETQTNFHKKLFQISTTATTFPIWKFNFKMMADGMQFVRNIFMYPYTTTGGMLKLPLSYCWAISIIWLGIYKLKVNKIGISFYCSGHLNIVDLLCKKALVNWGTCFEKRSLIMKVPV